MAQLITVKVCSFTAPLPLNTALLSTLPFALSSVLPSALPSALLSALPSVVRSRCCHCVLHISAIILSAFLRNCAPEDWYLYLKPASVLLKKSYTRTSSQVKSFHFHSFYPCRPQRLIVCWDTLLTWKANLLYGRQAAVGIILFTKMVLLFEIGEVPRLTAAPFHSLLHSTQRVQTLVSLTCEHNLWA